MQKIPIIGQWLRNYLFNNISMAYDIIINFIYGHAEAKKMIMAVIDNKNFVQQILMEAQKSVQ